MINIIFKGVKLVKDLEEVKEYLEEPTNRIILSQIIHAGHSLTVNELSSVLPSTSARSSLYSVLKKFEELGLIQEKKISIGAHEKVFYSPRSELLTSHLYQELLLKFEDLNWPSKLTMDFAYT